MAHFRVAQNGKNAITDPVQDMLIDSDYQTMLISGQGNGEWVDPAFGETFPLGIPLSFTPFCTMIIQQSNETSYFYQIPTPPLNKPIGLFPPGSNTMWPDQWIYKSDTLSNISYMYYIYYLPSMGEPSNAIYPPPNNPPYINVTNYPENAYITSLQNMAWTSQVQSLQIVNQSTFNVSATVSGASVTFTFPNPVGYITPFVAMVQNYSNSGFSYSLPSTSYVNFETIGILYSDELSIDNNNIYYIYHGTANNDIITINFNVIVYFFVQPL